MRYLNLPRFLGKATSLSKLMPIVTVAAAISSVPPTAEKQKGRPAHHVNDEGTAFHNPWPSWR